jgi:hypothetical protein
MAVFVKNVRFLTTNPAPNVPKIHISANINPLLKSGTDQIIPAILPALCNAIKVVIADSTLAGAKPLKPSTMKRVSSPKPPA